MTTTDDLSSYLADRLEGTYDCTDRITVRGYHPLGQTSGGLLTWWNQLFPNTALTEERLRKLAGDFGRRVNAYARKHKITLRYCATGEKDKHVQAVKLRPVDPQYRGVFAIFVAKAPGLVWQAKNNREGKVVVRWPKSWLEPRVWRYCDKSWIAGCIRPACVLRSTSSNKNDRAFATRIAAINSNTAAICCLRVGGKWMKCIKD